MKTNAYILESNKKPIRNYKYSTMSILIEMLDSWTYKQQIGKPSVLTVANYYY